MNILGIDYGTKKIGLAWVEDDLGVVLPFGLIKEDSREKQLEKLKQLVREEKADMIVCGLPYGVDEDRVQEDNENIKRIKNFAQDLVDITKLPLEFVDESFTTHEAKEMGGEASLDEKSAMLILQAWLKER